MPKQQKIQKFVSPQGMARFPWLSVADTKFDDDGVYQVELVCDPEEPEVQKLMQAIDKRIEEAVEVAKEDMTPAKANKVQPADPPYFPEEDEEGEETGRVIFKFKSKASGVSQKTGKKWARKIPLFDAAKPPKPLPEGTGVNHGSTIAINYSFSNPWYMGTTKQAGVTLRINAVQVIRAAEGGGGGDATEYGFGGVEGGYEADEADDEEAPYEGTSGDDDEDEGDF